MAGLKIEENFIKRALLKINRVKVLFKYLKLFNIDHISSNGYVYRAVHFAPEKRSTSDATMTSLHGKHFTWHRKLMLANSKNGIFLVIIM